MLPTTVVMLPTTVESSRAGAGSQLPSRTHAATRSPVTSHVRCVFARGIVAVTDASATPRAGAYDQIVDYQCAFPHGAPL